MDFLDKCINSIITSIWCENDTFCLGFALNGKVLKLYDNGQSCCERRYMVCDDTLSDFIGAKFLGYEVRNTSIDDIGDVHEVQFLIIHTSEGDITVANHNEHNGYYGGFSIEQIEDESV